MRKLIPTALILLAATVGCGSTDGSEVKTPPSSAENLAVAGADQWACDFFGKQAEKDLKTTETTTLLLTGEDGKPGAMFSENKSIHEAAKNLARASEDFRDGVSVPDWKNRLGKMKAACS